jgi:hypothetical protein
MRRTKIIVNGIEIWNYISEHDKQNEKLLRKVEQWIKENLMFRKQINRGLNSYQLKHIIEKDLGEYVSNVDVKRAMARIGIEGKLEHVAGWNYCYPIKKYRRLVK